MKFNRKIFDTFWHTIVFDQNEVKNIFNQHATVYRVKNGVIDTDHHNPFTLHEPVYNWLQEHFGFELREGSELDRTFYRIEDCPTSRKSDNLIDYDHRWCIVRYGLAFKHIDDALLFKLTWAGYESDK